MLASCPERLHVPQRLPPSQSLPLPRHEVSDPARIKHVALGTYGLPSPISPPPSSGAHDLSSDALLASAVVNPRMGPSALDVTLSPPLPLAELGDPFELLPPPCMGLRTPPRTSQGWRADLDDDHNDGDFGADSLRAPATGLLSPPADAFLANAEVGLGLETGHPESPASVSSDLEAVAYEGLRICLDSSEYWANVPFRLERQVKVEDNKGTVRTPSPPPPPCQPKPRQLDSLLDPAEEEDRKPDLSAPIDTHAGVRPPDNVTVRVRKWIIIACFRFSRAEHFRLLPQPFIWKLVKLLGNDTYAPWIQWDEEGRHILVALNHLRFLAVLGLFFRHSSVKSFVRQLHASFLLLAPVISRCALMSRCIQIYGFRRVPTSRLPDILPSLGSTTTAGAPRPDSYAAFHHPDFVRASASHQPRMLSLMRPGGGGQTSRTSTSTRNTRSRAARTVS
jgi:hypothetical protein